MIADMTTEANLPPHFVKSWRKALESTDAPTGRKRSQAGKKFVFNDSVHSKPTVRSFDPFGALFVPNGAEFKNDAEYTLRRLAKAN